jgi:geranylgeranyl pyrophosphate synthase
VRTYPIRHLGQHTRTLFDLLGHGKGLRSRKIYDIALTCGVLTPDHVAFASALEHIHTASLCHDDVLDNGHVRRGKMCIHHTHSHTQAVLLGDALVAEGFGILAHLPYPTMMSLACQCLAHLVEGQMAEHTLGPQSHQSSYIDMIAKKTGALFGLAYQGAGLISGLCPEKTRILHQSGCNAGIAYQLLDDCDEYERPVDQWTTGHDCLEKKWTLPILRAYHTHSKITHHALHTIWSDPQNKKARQDLVHILQPSIHCVRTLATQYEKKAHTHMTHLFTSPSQHP